MANTHRTTLYVGVTNDLERRVQEHKLGEFEGFTKRYKLNRLMYYEEFSDVREAIVREKVLKKWNREWKERIIVEQNPGWVDLSAKWEE